MCPNCSAALPLGALSCPACHQLVHATELQALSDQARIAESAGNWEAARDGWARALSLLPPQTMQYRSIEARISEIGARLAVHQEHQKNAWMKKFGWLGPVALLVWKFKFIAVFALTKAKFLLLGLTKLSTFVSMFASFGLYWSWYGWKFALGLVVSLYIHEMGHVAALRRYGIAATAPMFLPGFGAVVLLKQRPANVAQNARSGLAGPVWGLGAAVAAASIGVFSGAPLWFAIARWGAFINILNLIPILQLDGSRGFSALTRTQRGIVLGSTLLMWGVTADPILLLVAIGAGYRLFTKDYADRPDTGALLQFVSLLVALSLLMMGSGAFSRPV